MKKILLMISVCILMVGCASMQSQDEMLSEQQQAEDIISESPQEDSEDVEAIEDSEEVDTPDVTDSDVELIEEVVEAWTLGIYNEMEMSYKYDTTSKGTRLVINIVGNPEDVAKIYESSSNTQIKDIETLISHIKSDVTFEAVYTEIAESGELSQDIWGILINYEDPEDGVYSYQAFPSMF